jgi:hypothetical protein
MQKHFGDQATLCVNSLDAIRCQVLSLLQLKDILLSVDDSKATVLRVQLSNVTSPHPPIRSDGLLGDIGLGVVPEKYLWTSIPDFSPRPKSSLLINILGSVLHFRDIAQFELQSSLV